MRQLITETGLMELVSKPAEVNVPFTPISSYVLVFHRHHLSTLKLLMSNRLARFCPGRIEVLLQQLVADDAISDVGHSTNRIAILQRSVGVLHPVDVGLDTSA